MHHATDRIAHTTAFVTPVVEHWLAHCTQQHNRKEGIVLFNDALNTFYLGLYGISNNIIRQSDF